MFGFIVGFVIGLSVGGFVWALVLGYVFHLWLDGD